MTPLARFLADEIERGHFPGAAALIGSSEAVIETAYAGAASIEPTREPVSAETLWDLASLTKPLCTGALASHTPRETLASPPGRYFAGWKKTRYEGITIEMLLTHTSGLPPWFPLYARGEGAAAYRKTLAEIDPEAGPGTRVIYSDLNFLLLGEILESVFSAPLEKSFRELVATPAGSAAGFGPVEAGKSAATEKDDATERAMTESLGLSYTRFRKGVVRGEVHDGNAFRRGQVAGNAGLFATATDVWSLARTWLRDGRADWFSDRTPDLPESRGLAWQGKRGAGSAIDRMSSSAFGHTGFTGTSVWLDPDADRVVVLLTNRVHPSIRERDFNPVRRRFHEIVYNEFIPSRAGAATGR
jgi:CubicO group peptidase (beta-lactamase class C family)